MVVLTQKMMIMKKFIFTLAFTFIIATSIFSQSQNAIDELEIIENESENKNVDYTSEINIGNRFITITEHENKTHISIDKKNSERGKTTKFRGHLGGFGIGFNGFLTDFWSSSLNPGEEYLDINTAKSLAWSFTLPGISIGITRHFGFVSSVGLTLNNYRFDNNNSITKDEHGTIIPLYPAPDIVYKKSKLHTGYATIPAVLEVQIPTTAGYRNTLNISGGIVGAVKLWSRTKVVWNDGSRHKDKENNDFSLNLLRFGTTARIGYNNFNIYGTTYLTPMFEKGKGPEIYPFEIGMALTF